MVTRRHLACSFLEKGCFSSSSCSGSGLGLGLGLVGDTGVATRGWLERVQPHLALPDGTHATYLPTCYGLTSASAMARRSATASACISLLLVLRRASMSLSQLRKPVRPCVL